MTSKKNTILSLLDEIHEIADLNTIIRNCENRKRKLANDKFEKHYTKLAGDTYKSLNDIMNEIHMYCDDSSKFEDLENYVYNNPHNASISRILEYMDILKLQVSPSLKTMACKCCTCGNCPSMSECLGTSCDYCKKHNYTHYQYDCDE